MSTNEKKNTKEMSWLQFEIWDEKNMRVELKKKMSVEFRK